MIAFQRLWLTVQLDVDRVGRLFKGFVLSVVLVASGYANAATSAPAYTYTIYGETFPAAYEYGGADERRYPSLAAACASFIGNPSYTYYGDPVVSAVVSPIYQRTCLVSWGTPVWWSNDYTIPVYRTCPSPTIQYGSDKCLCPDGFSASGSTCTPSIPEPQSCTASQPGAQTTAPIIPATGEKQYTHSDYSGAGAHPLQLTRYFRSRWSSNANSSNNNSTGNLGLVGFTALGPTWSHNHAVSLTQSGSAGTADAQAVINLGQGSTRRFSWDTNTASWTASTTPAGEAINAGDTLVINSSGLLYKNSQDDSLWQFDASGKALKHTQRNGWANSYTYDAAGRLSRVTNHFGRSLNFSYNLAAQLVQVTSSDGQTIAYSFDASQRLSQVTYPGNATKTYLYENTSFPQSVTGIVDERGIRIASVVYDAQGRAVDSGYALGADRYQVSYPSTDATWTSAQVTDPLGTTRNYSYATALATLTVTSADKPSGSGGSDAASRVQNPATGLLDSEADFLGITTLYSWDASRRLPTSVTRAANQSEAKTTSTQWHPQYRLPTLITEAGRSTATTYDAQGNRLSETITDTSTDTSTNATAGQTRTWAWSYNTQGLVATSTDPRGQVSRYGYDAAGNLISAKNPLGQETRYAYDSAGRLIQETAPNNLVTTYSYDARGRVLQINQGAGAALETTTFSYTPSGQINSVSLPNGYAVTYSYDDAQRQTGAQDNRGNRSSYTLDGMGNRLREELRDASGSIASLTSRSINALNRVASLSGASGQTSQLGYDANGEPIAHTDPLNQTTAQSLDALRRPTVTTLADGSQVNVSYNPHSGGSSGSSALDAINSDIAQVTDPKGIATQYTRNAFGEVLQETSPDSGTTTYTRDADGNVIQTVDARGQSTTLTRDALGRAITIQLAGGQTQTFSYDAAGNLNQITDASGSSTTTHDAFGRILTKTQTVADNPSNPSIYRTSYQYHAGGQLAQITYPSGLKVYYRKNASGQINQVDVQQPGNVTGTSTAKPIVPYITNLTYTAQGQPKSWRWASGDAASRTFDTDGRMVSNEFAAYTYDANSRITGITQHLWASQSSVDPVTGVTSTTRSTTPVSWSASYDNRGRLTSFSRTSSSASSTYSYDANSNRLSAITTSTSDTDLDGDFDQADYSKTTRQSLNIPAGSNQLLGFSQTISASKAGKTLSTSTTQINYTLDAAGNLTSDGLRVFEYDAANRLSKVQISQGTDIEASKITYLHNALGQRVFKSEPQVAYTAPNETTLGTPFVAWLKSNFGWLFATAQANATLGQTYVYADSSLGAYNLLGEYGNGGNKSSGRIEYLWLPTEAGPSLPIGLFKASRLYAVHSDHLNTPRLITDDSNTPLWQWPYAAFGDNKPTGILKATTNPKLAYTNQPLLLQATTAPLEMNLRYPGQYFDEESNLSYNYFRSYQASQGRYPQADPIGLDGGMNRFGYVGGNALGFADPMGLAIKCKTIAKIPFLMDIQECTEDGTTPTEQEARDAKRMSNKELDRACKANGYEDAHALKREFQLDSKSDIFSDRHGNMYSGPRKGTGIPEYLHINTRGIVPR